MNTDGEDRPTVDLRVARSAFGFISLRKFGAAEEDVLSVPMPEPPLRAHQDVGGGHMFAICSDVEADEALASGEALGRRYSWRQRAQASVVNLLEDVEGLKDGNHLRRRQEVGCELWYHCAGGHGSMDDQLRGALVQYLAETMDRHGLQAVVSSYDVWNSWQDEDPEIIDIRPIIADLEQALGSYQ